MGARRAVQAAVVAWGLVGCAGGVTESETPLQSRVAELASPNGRNLNGRNLNGRNLNGSELGQVLVSVSFAGAHASATADDPMSSVWLQGSVFHGYDAGQEVSGTAFLGARFVGNLGDGQKVDLRVDEVQPGTEANADVWSYRVSFLDTVDGLWKPACPAADGSALNAIPVMGRWNYQQGVAGGGARIDDPTVFTFACEDAAIAKCVRFGYRPWETAADGRSLADHHQACTRMVRADFCGDGTSHTVDGNWVNLYDAVGVQQDTESWLLEAEWNAEGARCSSSSTRAPAPVSCPNKPQLSGCGQTGHFRTGTLLMSEVPAATTP
ncbi:ADYC domain-containing protein [Pyxidicoccus trucidator]|uniref:ADYC domain-containing protein n=1 Tax=Pyxidicoccus trucidator TaxID=2709662 RepID=UPI0019675EBE|nr:ADYC domain-containing protein [Pyxidicoccus trucidator]